MAKEVVENFRQMDDTFVRSIKRFNVNLAIMRWWRLSSWKRIQNKTELHQDRHDSQSKHTVGVKMLRCPFIFWLYSCKIWLLTLIDSPICTWWLVELFITKTGNQPITRGKFFLTAGDLNSTEVYGRRLKYLNKYCIIYPQLVEFELVWIIEVYQSIRRNKKILITFDC